MTRILTVLVAMGVALGASAGAAPAEDVVAKHARLVAAGHAIVQNLLDREDARNAYDKEGDRIAATDKEMQIAVEAQNQAQQAFAKSASDLAAAVKQHNATCGAGAAKAEPKQFKDKDAYQAAKDAEAARVANCEADVAKLKERQKAQDAEQARLKANHDALTKRIDAQNANADAIAARGVQLSQQLSAAEDAAEDWRAKISEVTDSSAFLARVGTVAGCKARREMVVSGKDLAEFLAFHETCAKTLAAHR